MKSHVRYLYELALCVFRDVNAKCAASEPIDRDLMTMRSRIEHEGLSFLTITLPAFGKGFERALSRGIIDPTDFRSFRKSGEIPAFLRGILGLVFDEGTGRIRDEPQIAAIEGVRQICYLFKKLEVPCSDARTRAAFEDFKSCEQCFNDALAPIDLDHFVRVSRALWPRVFGSTEVEFDSLRPRHGPGATAEKISGNQKFYWRRWHERLEPYFPLLHWAYSSENAMEGWEFEKIELVEACSEQPVRVIAVPKTLKAPRVIAIEPVCMQYAQQALAQYIKDAIEHSPLTRGRINFTDQSINREMALKSSADERFATLDLSSASDRVSYTVAIDMFDFDPSLKGAVSACRSTRAQMNDGSIIELRKFAAMGSALCFPVEAMYFYTICVGALLVNRSLPVTWRNVAKMCRLVYVYGDDIIVPVRDAAVVIDHLQRYYCKVNSAKSFWTGKFRESCGLDAYAGEEVTPTYVRQLRPNDKREAKKLISWVKTSNLFYKKGYWLAASHMIGEVESLLGALPIVGPNCSGFGKESFQPLISAGRWRKRYQALEVRTWVATPVYQDDMLDGDPALMKSLLALEAKRDSEPLTSKDHLMKTARHGAVALKRRWVRAH